MGKRNKPILIKCDSCGKLLKKHICHILKHNFCNRKCYANFITGKKLSLKTRKKMSKAQEGEKSNTWKGGISRTYKENYYSKEYKEWRMKVFVRDNFTCQNCRKVGIYITAHHIKSWAKYPELRFEVNNGITLCEDCHKLTDNYKGRNKGGY